MPPDPFDDAELEELAVLLAVDRSHPSDEFARELDARVARRFTPGPESSPKRRTRLLVSPAFGAGLTACLAAAVVVLALQLGGSTAHTGARLDLRGVAGQAQNLTPKQPPPPARAIHDAASAPAGSAIGGSARSGSATGAAGVTATPTPAPNGRRQVHSAQLTLGTAANRIDAVAQEVFNVVGRENGIVKRSQVTQGGQAGDGYADFNLSIPTSNLQQTVDQLSQLQYAHVVSRTDATQDVNNQFLTDQRQLADARALRTSLLKQLATAYTTTEIDSLKSQIHDADASISSDETALQSLQHRISFSSLSVQVNQGGVVLPIRGHRAASTGGGLTLGRAAHDAGKVLIVAAGVILIGLAALVPVGLLVALLMWVAHWLRHRRREQALDAA